MLRDHRIAGVTDDLSTTPRSNAVKAARMNFDDGSTAVTIASGTWPRLARRSPELGPRHGDDSRLAFAIGPLGP
jgi:hypothetical protein